MTSGTDTGAKYIFQDRLKNPDRLSILGTAIGGTLIVLPALSLTGFFFPSIADLGLGPLAVIAAVGGVVGFALYYRDRSFWFTGILPGLITGPLIAAVTVLYTNHRETLWNVEIAIPIIVGGLPGYAVYYFHLRALAVRKIARESEEDRRRLRSLVGATASDDESESS